MVSKSYPCLLGQSISPLHLRAIELFAMVHYCNFMEWSVRQFISQCSRIHNVLISEITRRWYCFQTTRQRRTSKIKFTRIKGKWSTKTLLCLVTIEWFISFSNVAIAYFNQHTLHVYSIYGKLQLTPYLNNLRSERRYFACVIIKFPGELFIIIASIVRIKYDDPISLVILMLARQYDCNDSDKLQNIQRWNEVTPKSSGLFY